jgi:hypothetical protein
MKQTYRKKNNRKSKITLRKNGGNSVILSRSKKLLQNLNSYNHDAINSITNVNQYSLIITPDNCNTSYIKNILKIQSEIFQKLDDPMYYGYHPFNQSILENIRTVIELNLTNHINLPCTSSSNSPRHTRPSSSRRRRNPYDSYRRNSHQIRRSSRNTLTRR